MHKHLDKLWMFLVGQRTRYDLNPKDKNGVKPIYAEGFIPAPLESTSKFKGISIALFELTELPTPNVVPKEKQDE